jgi:hypothetical protein
VGDHKFKIGQLVDYIGRQRAAGVYTVTARLPSEDDDCRYRIKNVNETHERVALVSKKGERLSARRIDR